MARLTTLAAILATILLLVANTYAIRTTISTVEIAEATNRRTECREQILCGGYPSFCMPYILRAPVEIDFKTMCCTQMRNLDDECHCEALERLLVDLKLHFPASEEVEQILADAKERAQNIPEYCNLKERCRIRII